MPTQHNRQQGEAVEQAVLRVLQRKGMRLVTCNYRCSMGEIDLIMLDQETLVFIEVKQRSRGEQGHPAEQVSIGKQRKIIRTALHFLQQHPHFSDQPCRFDVIAIQAESIRDMDWFQDAFQCV